MLVCQKTYDVKRHIIRYQFMWTCTSLFENEDTLEDWLITILFNL